MSLLGNTLVLCGSCKYNAIDLDEVTLVFIQNLAIADLMNVVLLEIPSKNRPVNILPYIGWVLRDLDTPSYL